MWSGNQRPTSAASAGCVTAMPAPMTPSRRGGVDRVGRCGRGAPLPTAVNAKPGDDGRVAPSRATSREPTNAAAANRMIGRPVRMPISVPERLNSLRSAGMTGGTARSGIRSALPTSQSRASAVREVGISPRNFSVRDFFWAGSRGLCSVRSGRRLRLGANEITPRLRAALRASASFALRVSASSRFSRSPSTTSSGARLRKSALPSFWSTRAMSASHFAISLSSRARSAARSITP